MYIEYMSENMTFKTKSSVNAVPLFQLIFNGVGNRGLKAKRLKGRL